MKKVKQNPKTAVITASILLIILVLSIAIIFSHYRGQTQMVYPPNTFLVIRNSGTTNSPGFTITINKDGSGTLAYAKCTSAPTTPPCNQPDKTFPPKTFNITTVTNTLSQIGNIQGIPNHTCTKPASFDSVTTIAYNGQTSGDISCIGPTDSQTYQNLEQEVNTFTSQAINN